MKKLVFVLPALFFCTFANATETDEIISEIESGDISIQTISHLVQLDEVSLYLYRWNQVCKSHIIQGVNGHERSFEENLG